MCALNCYHLIQIIMAFMKIKEDFNKVVISAAVLPIVYHCCQTTIWSKLFLLVCVRAHTSVRSNSHHMPSVCSLRASHSWEVLPVTLAYPALRWGHVCGGGGGGVHAQMCVCTALDCDLSKSSKCSWCRWFSSHRPLHVLSLSHVPIV